MGYENKINRLLTDRVPQLLDVITEVYRTNPDEYVRLNTNFENDILAMPAYEPKQFMSIIAKSYYGDVWKTLTNAQQLEIVNEIGPVFIREKRFSDHLENAPSLQCVFLEMPDKIIVYCNGMYAPFSEDDKSDNIRLRNALRIPSVTVKDNPSVLAYAQTHENFPLYLHELPFLKPLLGSVWTDTPVTIRDKSSVEYVESDYGL